MIWQNPWAWLGMVGVALPILIHLLGRGHARVLRFPTLRFIDPSRLLPTKRSRIQDPLLLAVRVAIVGCAAIALAQPLLLTSARRHTLDRGLARAIIVDTSASMRGTAVDSARAVARQLAGGAQSSIVVETSKPRAVLAGAAAWIAKQQRAGEIAIVSDFQRGELTAEDLARLPATVGVVLRAVRRPPPDSVIVRTISAGHAQTASATPTQTGVDASWRAPTDSAIDVPATLLGARDEEGALDAVRSAAATLPVALPVDTARAITVVFPRYLSRDSLIAALTAPRAAWTLAFLSQARDDGLGIVAAGDAAVAGKRQFVIVANVEPSSVDAARLVSLARRATSVAPIVKELEPSVVSAAELRRWERATTAVSTTTRFRATDENGPSDARWIWAVVLALLVVEWRLRRRAAVTATIAAAERARAA